MAKLCCLGHKESNKKDLVLLSQWMVTGVVGYHGKNVQPHVTLVRRSDGDCVTHLDNNLVEGHVRDRGQRSWSAD